MSIRTSTKKAAFAALMVAPLFLAACGSDSEEADVTTSSTAAASTTTTKSATSSATSSAESSAEETTEAPSESAAAEPIDPAAEQQQLDALASQLSETPVTFAELAPVEGGQAASPEDSQAIEALVRGAAESNTLRGSLSYMMNNTCSRVLQANGATNAIDLNLIPDTPLGGDGTGGVDSVSDVVVDGEAASAWVVASAGGTTDSGTQRFVREAGQWKFCD